MNELRWLSAWPLGVIGALLSALASAATIFGLGWRIGWKLGAKSIPETTQKELGDLRQRCDVLHTEVEERTADVGKLRGQLGQIEQLVSGDVDYWLREADTASYFRRINDSIPIVVVANFKGGVGKTTLAANLAAYFDDRGKRVLLVDFDYQGSLSDAVLPYGADNVDFSANLLLDPTTNAKDALARTMALQPALPRSRLFSAFYELNRAENRAMFKWLVQGGGADVRYATQRIFSDPEFQKRFDLVIIDAPPRLMTATVNAACASTHFIIPTILDGLSVSAALNTLGVFRQIQKTIAPQIQPAAIIPTMVAAQPSLNLSETIALKELKDGLAHFWPASPAPVIFDDAYVCRKAAIARTAGSQIAYLADGEIAKMFDPIGAKLEARLFHAGPRPERGPWPSGGAVDRLAG